MLEKVIAKLRANYFEYFNKDNKYGKAIKRIIDDRI